MKIFQPLAKSFDSLFLSLFCVLAFSSSWIVIGKQVKAAGFLWPLAFRFFLASLFLMIWSFLKKNNKSLSFQQKKMIILQSFLMYSFNFIAIYAAAKDIPKIYL